MPLESEQLILNAVYDASTNSLRVNTGTDAAADRVSAIQDSAANLNVSAKSDSAALFRVSAFSDSAALLRVSALSQDGGLTRVSSVQDGAAALNVSAKSQDGGLFRVSSLESATAAAGGASVYFTSAGATSQVSTVKASVGRLYGYDLGNAAGVDQYLQIFNASAGAQAGTDTPTMSVFVPTLKDKVASFPAGISFANGIQIIGTSTVNGQTIGASALRVNLIYA